MPKYRVQLKQGKRTIVEYIESDSVNSVLSFYNSLTTMKVSQILEVKYIDESDPPVDDFSYFSVVKVICSNDYRQSRQFIFHNVKLTVDENKLSQLLKNHIQINSHKITSVVINMFRR
ncbi:hypothetical protein [Persephonella sp.]